MFSRASNNNNKNRNQAQFQRKENSPRRKETVKIKAQVIVQKTKQFEKQISETKLVIWGDQQI